MIQTLLGYDWFIAYGHSDKGAPKSAGQSLARSLALELRKRGYRVCIDVEEYHPGQKLSLLTRLRVGSSSHFILVLDPKAARSEWVRRELDVAQSRKRTLVLIDVDDTFARIASSNPIHGAFLDQLRVSYAAETVSQRLGATPDPGGVVAGSDARDVRAARVKDIADQLQRGFDGNTVERVERRIAITAACVGLSLAGVASYFAWMAREEAAELEARQWLSGAERARAGGDRSNARLLLEGVSEERRTGHWRSLDFALSTSDPGIIWQADEVLLGAVDGDRFATFEPGWVHVRSLNQPWRRTDLAWPEEYRSLGYEEAVASFGGGRYLRIRLGHIARLWDLQAGASSMARADGIEVDAVRDRLLTVDGKTATLRRLSTPQTELSRYEFADAPSGYTHWSEEGIIVTSEERAVLLTPQSTEPLPFEIYPQLHGEVLDSVVLESLGRVAHGGASMPCPEKTVLVRSIRSGWPLLTTLSVCDTLLPQQRAVWEDRWVTWDRLGLMIIDLGSGQLQTRRVGWDTIPDCLDPLRQLRCDVRFDLDSRGEIATLPVDDRHGKSERSYQVELETGKVSALSLSRPGAKPDEVLDAFIRPHAIVTGSDAHAVAYEPGELLVWRKPVPLLAPRPWRLDLPRPLGPTRPPRIVLGSNALVAAFDDVTAVRVWSFSGRDQLAGMRHQGIAWLRDGRFFAWDNHSTDGFFAPVRFSIGKPGATTPDVEFEPPSTAEAERCAPPGRMNGNSLPSTAVLSGDGRRIILLQHADLSWVFDLETHPPRCIPLGDSLRDALGGAGGSDVAVDEAGDWLAVTSHRGTRLWSSKDLSGSGWPISPSRLMMPRLSADGGTLVALRPTGEIARWRIRGAPRQEPEIEPLALAGTALGSVESVSRTGEWVLLLGTLGRGGGEVVNLASKGRARLTGFPETPKKALFSPGGQRLAVVSCTHEIFIWDLQDPDRPPIEFANGDPIEDFRWLDDDRGEALFYDGTAMVLGTGSASATSSVARLPCLPRVARRKYLEETSEEATKAYSECMQGFAANDEARAKDQVTLLQPAP
jgi:WD40 repeat protein